MKAKYKVGDILVSDFLDRSKVEVIRISKHQYAIKFKDGDEVYEPSIKFVEQHFKLETKLDKIIS